MSPEKTSTSQKICPTCGTRISDAATRCPVCGRALTANAKPSSGSDQSVRGPRMPEITLSLPRVIGLFILLIGLGGGVVYAVTRPTPQPTLVAGATQVLTPTITPTITQTPTPTNTSTPQPTFTPLPPKEYIVKDGDNCGKIALTFGVSIPTIIQFNTNLNSECTNLSIGQKLLIPQATPTATLAPSSTAQSSQATDKACDLFPYQVKDGDTLGGIAASFNVAPQSIKDYNGMTTDVVLSGNTLKIPLCKRLPTPGPTPTPTPPPPYPAPNLLLPANGAVFIAAGDVITVQWSAVGTLRQNEFYAVSIEDLTDGSGKKVVDYVNDTKYIVPTSLRPSGTSPHIFQWSVLPVRQTGSNKDGQPIYEPGGQVSAPRVFGWVGGGGAAITPTP